MSKIKDGLKLRGAPVEIPDCLRADLPEFFKEMGYKVGAEIGVDRGIFSEIIGKSGLKLYCIDPWTDYYNYQRSTIDQVGLDKMHDAVKKRLAPYDCTLIRKTSMEALEDFKDESLDFVYIDGNHNFRYVSEDIWEWYRKVKKGGVISGHDYVFTPGDPYRTHACHVWYVVPVITKVLGIRNWYVLGERYVPNRDRHRSWFFIKP